MQELVLLFIHQQHPIADAMMQLDCELVVAHKHSDLTKLVANSQPHIILVDPCCLSKKMISQLLQLKQDRCEFLPILLVVNQDAPNFNSVSLEAIDDIIWYPSHQVVIEKKLRLFRKIQQMQEELEHKQFSLDKYRHLLKTEHSIAENIFENIIRTGTINMPNMRFALSPMSTFNGDVLLATKNPDGLLHVVLGDFTGHGLPAAIGAIPMAEVFYSMTQKNFKPEEIILEINQKLKELLPNTLFCATSYLEINEKKLEMRYWNGGLPDGVLYRPKHGIFKKLSSTHLPLGINPNAQVEPKLKTIQIRPDDRIYLYTDGIIDAKNLQDEKFSMQRLFDIINDREIASEQLFNTIRERVNTFCGSQQQGDDLTLMELKVMAQ